MTKMSLRLAAVCCLGLLLAAPQADSGPLRQRVLARMKEKSVSDAVDPAQIVPGATRQSVAYGSDPAQTLDVYLPPNPKQAPVLVMVHGGGWRIGDKTSRGVVENKLKHWLPKGYVVVSVNYRMLPDAAVSVQAQDVAAAVAFVESHAAGWGADAKRLVLMGHSAGAHLVGLLSADPSLVTSAGGAPWAATVVLDSAAMDVTQVMQGKHLKLYDDAFGKDPAYWRSLSPSERLSPQAVPMMLVCALKRPDDSCGQARDFATKAAAVGLTVPVLPQDKTHMEVNADLGAPGDYTQAVDVFIAAHIGPDPA